MNRKRIVWSDAMLEKMYAEYPITFDWILAEELQVSVNSIRRKARDLKISKQYSGRKNMVARKIIKENYHSKSYRQLARMAGVNVRTVVNIVIEYQLSRSDEETARLRSQGVAAFIKKERARAIFGLPQKSSRKVFSNRKLTLMRSRLAKNGYVVIYGSNVVYFSHDMKRHYQREENARTLGIVFEQWNATFLE